MDCGDAAEALAEMARLYEVRGDGHRARAYGRAARGLAELDGPLEEALRDGRAARASGVGEAVRRKLEELVDTGRIAKLEELRQAVPPGLLAMMRVPGLSAKRAQQLHDQFGVRDLEELRAIAEAGHLASMPGFGEKVQADVLEALGTLGREAQAVPLPIAQRLADGLASALEAHADQVLLAGPLRRRRDQVEGIRLLVMPRDGEGAMEGAALLEALRGLPGVEAEDAGGDGLRLLLPEGVQAEVGLAARDAVGAALLERTGSEAHHARLRAVAAERGWTLDGRGLWEGPRRLAGEREEEVYARLGLAWVPPELREDAGEVEAAREGNLPRLVEETDLQGDLHNHSSASDGDLSPEQWVRAAGQSGLAYVGLSDHSDGLPWGLSGPELVAHRQRVLELADRHARPAGVEVLVGVEANIKRDGSLDVGANHLDQLDYVLAGVHTHMRLDAEEQTKRIVAALRSGRIDILSHPTGRRMGERPPLAYDREAVFRAAAEGGTALEVDGLEPRLDLNGELIRVATGLGCRRFTVDSDCHATPHRGRLRFALDQARRGWLTTAEVLTTRPTAEAMLRELKSR